MEGLLIILILKYEAYECPIQYAYFYVFFTAPIHFIKQINIHDLFLLGTSSCICWQLFNIQIEHGILKGSNSKRI